MQIPRTFVVQILTSSQNKRNLPNCSNCLASKCAFLCLINVFCNDAPCFDFVLLHPWKTDFRSSLRWMPDILPEQQQSQWQQRQWQIKQRQWQRRQWQWQRWQRQQRRMLRRSLRWMLPNFAFDWLSPPAPSFERVGPWLAQDKIFHGLSGRGGWQKTKYFMQSTEKWTHSLSAKIQTRQCNGSLPVYRSFILQSSMWLKNVTNELAFRYISLKLKSEHVDVPPIFVQLLFYKFIDDPFTLPVSSLYI